MAWALSPWSRKSSRYPRELLVLIVWVFGCQSPITMRCRSRLAVARSHFSPGAEPQVGQRTASICFGLISTFMER